MANSPSSWVSFSDYLGLVGDAQRQMEDEAFKRAQGLEGDAGNALHSAELEASQSGGAVTQSVSYGQYLDLKRKADEAYRAPSRAGDPLDWRANSVRSVVDQGRGTQTAVDMQGRMRGAETAAQSGADARRANDARMRAQYAAEKQHAADAEAAQQSRFGAAQEYSNALTDYRQRQGALNNGQWGTSDGEDVRLRAQRDAARARLQADSAMGGRYFNPDDYDEPTKQPK